MQYAYVVAEDHQMTADGIAELLKIQFDIAPETICKVNDGPELLELIRRGIAPQALLILDLLMPGRPRRLPLLRTVLSLEPSLQIVVNSAEDSPFLVEAAMNEGALAFVSKVSPRSILLQAVRCAKNGSRFIDPRIDISTNTRHAWRKLTEREVWTVLNLCQGVRMKELAATAGIKYQTIAEYRQSAMKKLGVREPAALSTYLINNGLAFLLDDD